MSPLRRVPRKLQPNDHRPVYHYPLGLIRIDRNGIDGLVSLLRKVGNTTVRIYAGDDVSPRRIKSIQDAADRELVQVKIVLDRPKVTIRLSQRSAFISSSATTVKATEIIAVATRYFEQYRSPLFRLRHYFNLLVLLGIWGTCLLEINRVDNLWIAASMSVLIFPSLLFSTAYLIYLYIQCWKGGLAHIESRPIARNRPKLQRYSKEIFSLSLGSFFFVIVVSLLIVDAVLP